MKFTILVPTMGVREKEIERFFISLSNQTYKDFDVVIVSQINHNLVENIVSRIKDIKIKHIKLEKAGLSYARNQGLKYCDGEWIILSDDDAWYPIDGLEKLSKICNQKYCIVLSQIFDPVSSKLYKNYSKKQKEINNKFELMKKSSIEIAINREKIKLCFDERFGLGAKYVGGEENDFLMRAYKCGKICYFPTITVYHQKKDGTSSPKQQLAKGAIYAKHYNRGIAMLIVLRDIIKRRNASPKMFWQGFNEYRKENISNE